MSEHEDSQVAQKPDQPRSDHGSEAGGEPDQPRSDHGSEAGGVGGEEREEQPGPVKENAPPVARASGSQAVRPPSSGPPLAKKTPVVHDVNVPPSTSERVSHFTHEIMSEVNSVMKRVTPAAPLATPMPDPEITVASWNIRSCIGVGIRTQPCNPAPVASLIKKHHVDIVGLQEVENGTARFAGRMHVELMEACGFADAAFLKTCEKFGGDYGIAVVSRYPILEKKGVLFGDFPGKETRGALAVRVQPPQYVTDVWFVTTHLQNDVNGVQQELQANDLANFVDTLSPAGSVVVTGDFNSPPYFASIKKMKQRGYSDIFYQYASKLDLGLTHPSYLPIARLDYIFVAASTDFRVRRLPKTVPTSASDHRPVIASLYM